MTFEVAGGADDGSAGDEDAPATGDTARVAATPAVRKLAKDLGVDLAAVTATGPSGRVTDDDVRAAAAQIGRADAAQAASERVPVTALRRTIAENLERQAAIPQVTTFRTVDCSALEAFRREHGLSPLPVLVATLSSTIPAHPLLNASWGGDAILLHRIDPRGPCGRHRARAGRARASRRRCQGPRGARRGDPATGRGARAGSLGPRNSPARRSPSATRAPTAARPARRSCPPEPPSRWRSG